MTADEDEERIKKRVSYFDDINGFGGVAIHAWYNYAARQGY